jgi:methionyl-tRNA synthetase
MNNNFFASWFGRGGFFTQPIGILVFILILVWTLVWKALALWRAARRGSEWWFLALLVLNTVGILEIIYLYVFSKPDAPVALSKEGEKKEEEKK